MKSSTTNEFIWDNNTANNQSIDREQYEKDLKRRQREHLEQVQKQFDIPWGNDQWQPCMHDGCPECHGTGVRRDGGSCIHSLSCPCPKCSPRF